MNVKETLLATVIGLAFVSQVYAQEAVVTEMPVPVEIVAPIVASDQLQADFVAICASNAQLSDKAKLACVNNALPEVAKTQDTFRNVGVGAEFNTLIRNKTMFAAAN